MGRLEVPSAEPCEGLHGVQVAYVRWSSDAEPEPGLLTPSERTIFHGLSSPRRRLEWCAGRLAARAALRAKGAGWASILANEQGAPICVLPQAAENSGAETTRVAISHGRCLAGAAATGHDEPWPHVGIDIVDPEDIARIERLSQRVLTTDEQQLALEDPSMLALAWGAREAVAKATRTGMFAFALEHVALRGVDGFRLTLTLPGMEATYFTTARGETVVVAGISEDAYRAAQRQARQPMT